jgi:Lrp/AsnC family transcriptional regulator, leucine-responsive regulatory protein
MKKTVIAFVFVQTASGGQDEPSRLAAIPEVEEVHRIAGEESYVLRIRTASVEELGRVVSQKIEAIGSVFSTRTTVVLKTFKQRRPVIFDTRIAMHSS